MHIRAILIYRMPEAVGRIAPKPADTCHCFSFRQINYTVTVDYLKVKVKVKVGF